MKAAFNRRNMAFSRFNLPLVWSLRSLNLFPIEVDCTTNQVTSSHSADRFRISSSVFPSLAMPNTISVRLLAHQDTHLMPDTTSATSHGHRLRRFTDSRPPTARGAAALTPRPRDGHVTLPRGRRLLPRRRCPVTTRLGRMRT